MLCSLHIKRKQTLSDDKHTDRHTYRNNKVRVGGEGRRGKEGVRPETLRVLSRRSYTNCIEMISLEIPASDLSLKLHTFLYVSRIFLQSCVTVIS